MLATGDYDATDLREVAVLGYLYHENDLGGLPLINY